MSEANPNIKNLRALIFDVDGTLADIECDGHRPVFNAAFHEAGLDWHWDETLYGELLAVTGCIPLHPGVARLLTHGLHAALGAGPTTIVTPCDYTRGQDFSGAAAVLDSLDGISLADLRAIA